MQLRGCLSLISVGSRDAGAGGEGLRVADRGRATVWVVTCGIPATTSVFSGLGVRSRLKITLKVGSNMPEGRTLPARPLR